MTSRFSQGGRPSLAAVFGLIAMPAALLATMPAEVQAQSAIYAAGATLPAPVLRQFFDCISVPVVGKPVNPTPPAVNCNANPAPEDNVQFLYSAIGSGNGLNAFVTKTPPTAVPGPNEPPPTSSLFPRYPYPFFHFAGSEAFLDQARIDTYNETNNFDALYGPIVQIPFAATSVALSYNRAGLNVRQGVPQGGTGGMRLSLEQYCAIWGGYVTNWQDPIFAATNAGQPLALFSLPIQRVVRSDSSGTTFLFTNRLAEQCANTAYPFPYTPGTTVAWNSAGSPVLAGNGNGGVAGCVANQLSDTNGDGLCEETGGAYANGRGRIGYNSPSFIEPFVANNVASANLATRSDPTFYAPPAVFNTTRGVQNIEAPCLGGPGCPSPNPGLDPRNWGSIQGDGTDGELTEIEYPSTTAAYPIVGVTFLDFYTCYFNGNIASGISRLINFQRVNGANAQAILARNGFAPLNLGVRNAIRQLALDDPRTRIRRGPAAAGAGFPGCTSGG